ncbi:hypothetical protein [Streptomyces sp. NPDC093591]|uniref:hypothetical protein n=1 Tax=Streptomyces sp. NPDC093591 TaxID=3366044 RepID=UPI0038109014
MASSQRFHLDRDGHSVSVQTGGASGVVELLVDGKVVASQRRRRRDAMVLAVELPSDPPRPFSVHVDWSTGTGGRPVCMWEIDGTRDLIPVAPLVARQVSSRADGTTALHPLRGLCRLARRCLRHLRAHRR